MNEKPKIALVYPAGSTSLSQVEREKRIFEFKNLGYEVIDLFPNYPPNDFCTSSPVLERVSQLSYALTRRKFSLIMVGRGGVGTTELIPYLENCLPPVIPDKIFVGFSDASFLGVYLSCRYPNFTYVHGPNFFTPNLFSEGEREKDTNALFDIFEEKENTFTFPAIITYPENNALRKLETQENKINGVCVPLNLSLAESLSACSFLSLPKNNILFLEDCNEYLYRIIRKIDSLINSSFLKETKAIVLGSFNGCLKSDESPISRDFLISLFAKKTNLPVINLPIFGHDNVQFPLMMKSEVLVNTGPNSKITLSHSHKKPQSISTSFSPELFKLQNQNNMKTKVHFTGIGGSGMAQVAGFFKEAGFELSGSDDPIYPPMDKIINQLNVKPEVGFNSDNISKNNPDIIVLANVVSRLSGSLKKNLELDSILNQQRPVLSFPSALRKYFLHSSRNIVISGTHGKTTTSSLVTFLLDKLNYNPSFLIGGSPVNFKAGFALNSKKLFVLEGDEYDSALFDKGPKFLHYEPKIGLINNIEFDHADIYDNVEMIENEFLRLAQLTFDKQGILVVNYDDVRVKKIADKFPQYIERMIAFSNQGESSCKMWKITNLKTTPSGSEITALTPENKKFSFKTKVFGAHNALNCMAAFAVLHANQILENAELASSISKLQEYDFIEKASLFIEEFKGVKRRFELLAEKNNISVFDDFAHHPTAVSSTVKSFRDYILSSGKKGRLIVCFDPRNATMRRNILQNELIESFSQVDVLYLGKVFKDLRLNPKEALDGHAVALACGEKSTYFEDNELLLETLKKNVKSGDTVVFMSAGAFDGIPHKFADIISVC